jgi:hypothetical protein
LQCEGTKRRKKNNAKLGKQNKNYGLQNHYNHGIKGGVGKKNET